MVYHLDADGATNAALLQVVRIGVPSAAVISAKTASAFLWTTRCIDGWSVAIVQLA